MVEFWGESIPLHYVYLEVLFQCWEMHFFHCFLALPLEILTHN